MEVFSCAWGSSVKGLRAVVVVVAEAALRPESIRVRRRSGLECGMEVGG